MQHQCDLQEGRSPLHYCGRSGDPPWLWTALRQAGADPSLLDGRGRSPAYYMDHPLEAELPIANNILPGGRFTSGGNGSCSCSLVYSSVMKGLETKSELQQVVE